VVLWNPAGAVFNFIMTDHDLMIMRKIESYFNSPVAEVKTLVAFLGFIKYFILQLILCLKIF
jgi:hypothetical protein